MLTSFVLISAVGLVPKHTFNKLLHQDRKIRDLLINWWYVWIYQIFYHSLLVLSHSIYILMEKIIEVNETLVGIAFILFNSFPVISGCITFMITLLRTIVIHNPFYHARKKSLCRFVGVHDRGIFIRGIGVLEFLRTIFSKYFQTLWICYFRIILYQHCYVYRFNIHTQEIRNWRTPRQELRCCYHGDNKRYIFYYKPPHTGCTSDNSQSLFNWDHRRSCQQRIERFSCLYDGTKH